MTIQAIAEAIGAQLAVHNDRLADVTTEFLDIGHPARLTITVGENVIREANVFWDGEKMRVEWIITDD